MKSCDACTARILPGQPCFTVPVHPQSAADLCGVCVGELAQLHAAQNAEWLMDKRGAQKVTPLSNHWQCPCGRKVHVAKLVCDCGRQIGTGGAQ